MNPMQMLMKMYGNNPQQIIQGIFNQNPGFAQQVQNSDIYKNATQMLNSGNTNGVENLVRNVYQNGGMNINQFMNYMQNRRFKR